MLNFLQGIVLSMDPATLTLVIGFIAIGITSLITKLSATVKAGSVWKRILPVIGGALASLGLGLAAAAGGTVDYVGLIVKGAIAGFTGQGLYDQKEVIIAWLGVGVDQVKKKKR